MRETIENEVTVIGAGLSGVCAAIMAARKGHKVALVGDRPVLGGNSSSEMRMWTRGATGGENIYAEEMGILGEVKLENLYKNRDANVIFWDEVLLDAVFAEENITLFLNTCVHDVTVDNGNRIRYVEGFQQGSEKRFQFVSEVFIDTTGDGTVGYLAGLEFTMGREGREVYGERFAPEKSDEYGLGSSLFFYSKEMDEPVSYIPPDYAYTKDDVAPLLGSGGRIVTERMNGTDFWWLEYGGIRDTIRDNQDITLELKRIVYGIWDYIKNSGEFEADNLTLEWVGTLACKRESRRFKGEYILTQQDVEEKKYFDDGVCYGGWYMDFHPPEGIYSTEEFCIQTPVSVYAIPMRCLYSRKIDNLLFAGRLISVTHAAFSSTRIMDTCALTGQAAGMIAAFMQQHRMSADQVYKSCIADLQQELLKNDMFIPEISNVDTADKARDATVTTSSVRPLENQESLFSLPLHDDFYLLFAGFGEEGTFSLKLDCSTATTVEYSMLDCEYRAGFRPGKEIIQGQIPVHAGEEQWISLPVDITASFLSESTSYYLLLRKNEQVNIHCAPYSAPGFIGRYANSKKLYHPCFLVKGTESIYGSGNIISGFNRPHDTPHIWISDAAEKAWVELKWNTEIEIREVRIFFDPDLSMELVNTRNKNFSEHHGFVPRDAMPPELVKSYRIVVNQQGMWREVERISENIMRMVIHTWDRGLYTDALRIECDQTWGCPYFHLYEVRVY